MSRSVYMQFISEIPQEKIQEYFQQIKCKEIRQVSENSYTVFLQESIDHADLRELAKASFPHKDFILCTGRIYHSQDSDYVSS